MTVTAPNGKTLTITGDHVPTETELQDIFTKAGVNTGASPEGQPVNAAEQFRKGPQAVVDVPSGGSSGNTLTDRLQRMAHPQTDSDLMSLITAPTDITRGAIENLPTIIKAAKDLPGDVVAGAKDLLSGAKDQAGSAVMMAAHPKDTLEAIGRWMIGSEEPHPMEVQAATKELAAMRLRLQAANSITRQVDAAKSLPVADELQAKAGDMVDALHKVTSSSGVLDASGKPLASTNLGDFGNKFVQSVKDQLATGKQLSGSQYQILQRMYKTVFP